MSSSLDNLTVCITNFKRAGFLDRAIRSVFASGVKRLVVASAEPDEDVLKVINFHRQNVGWLSFEFASVRDDIGCNDTWQLAAYHSRTDRIIILHDDDLLTPEFGQAYVEKISPALDRGEFVTWRAKLVYEDGSERKTEYWNGPTKLYPAQTLQKFLGTRGRLSLSPIVSVMDRKTVIHACKEAFHTLIHPECYLRPGMLLGTELVVYIRHIQAARGWFYVDQILSCYGSHAGSGTVAAESSGDLSPLIRGYDRARARAEGPKFDPPARVLFAYYDNPTTDSDEIERNRVARLTWDFHFGQSEMIEFQIRPSDLSRSSKGLNDTRDVPYVRDCFDFICARAMPEDVVAYCNRDIGLTGDAVDRLLAGVRRGKGVTCCQRRWVHPTPGRMYRNIVNCRPDGGFDVFAITPAWWAVNRGKMPDMLIGREAWDTCFRALAEEHADFAGRMQSKVGADITHWSRSNAYTDLACWHRSHYSNWIAERLTAPGQLHNRALAKSFFSARGNRDLVKQLS